MGIKNANTLEFEIKWSKPKDVLPRVMRGLYLVDSVQGVSLCLIGLTKSDVCRTVFRPKYGLSKHKDTIKTTQYENKNGKKNNSMNTLSNKLRMVHKMTRAWI